MRTLQHPVAPSLRASDWNASKGRWFQRKREVLLVSSTPHSVICILEVWVSSVCVHVLQGSLISYAVFVGSTILQWWMVRAGRRAGLDVGTCQSSDATRLRALQLLGGPEVRAVPTATHQGLHASADAKRLWFPCVGVPAFCRTIFVSHLSHRNDGWSVRARKNV